MVLDVKPARRQFMETYGARVHRSPSNLTEVGLLLLNSSQIISHYSINLAPTGGCFEPACPPISCIILPLCETLDLSVGLTEIRHI